MLNPLAERSPVDSGTVRVLIGMYSQGRGTKTAHMDMVHMGRFGSVGTLWVCGHAMPVMGAVVAVSSRIL